MSDIKDEVVGFRDDFNKSDLAAEIAQLTSKVDDLIFTVGEVGRFNNVCGDVEEANKYLKRLVEVEEYKYNELLDNPRDSEVGDIYTEVTGVNLMLVELYKMLDCRLQDMLDAQGETNTLLCDLKELMQNER